MKISLARLHHITGAPIHHNVPRSCSSTSLSDEKINIILTVLHAHSQSHIITAHPHINFQWHASLGLFKLGKPTRGSWWNTSIATAHCIPICMQMVYQENSIPSNQQVKNNCNLHFRATIQSLMNRKEKEVTDLWEDRFPLAAGMAGLVQHLDELEFTKD